jgi:hypothetical protein
MPEDGQSTVQPVVPSTGETTPTNPVQEAKPVAQPSMDKSEMAELIRVEVAKATELAKREIQSVKDKAAAEISRHISGRQLADTIARTATSKLRDLDPATATELELQQVRNELGARKAQEQQELQLQSQQETQNQLLTDLQDEIKEIGVDPNDPKLQGVGAGAKDWSSFHKIVFKKAVEIKKEQEKTMATQSDEVKKLQDELKTLRKQLNLESNSVDSSTPGATAVKGIPTNSAELGAWIAANPAEYRKRKQDVYDLQRKGLIH